MWFHQWCKKSNSLKQILGWKFVQGLFTATIPLSADKTRPICMCVFPPPTPKQVTEQRQFKYFEQNPTQIVVLDVNHGHLWTQFCKQDCNSELEANDGYLSMPFSLWIKCSWWLCLYTNYCKPLRQLSTKHKLRCIWMDTYLHTPQIWNLKSTPVILQDTYNIWHLWKGWVGLIACTFFQTVKCTLSQLLSKQELFV